MKNNSFHTILAVFTLLTAMSIVSCEKETYTQPVDETIYYLSVGEVPEIVSGNDTTVTVKVQTNIPANELNVGSSDKWLIGHVNDGNIVIRFDENPAGVRSGTVTVNDTKHRTESASCTFTQGYARRQAVNKPGMVQFKDYFFKQACLEIADTDHDGEISPQEAETVQELVVPGKRINDLTGLEAFKNVWKLDAGNNNIEDATLVKEHPYLHWLNLKGNKNLKTFDVRGCSMYFEFCDFEVTESLSYQLYYRQMGVTEADFADWKQKWENSGKTYDGPPHSHHSVDPRKTQDWTREGEMNKVSTHSKGNGKLGIILSGIGYIDRDIEDGTFDRIMNEAVEALGNKTGFKENWEYFDVYVMYHMAMSHSQWMHAADSQDYINERRELIKKIPAACDNDYCYCFLIDSHSNMAFEEFLVQQLPAITYKNGDYLPPMTQMCPIPNFDSESETIYPFHHVDKIIDQYISFDCIQSMNWTWK